MSGTAHDPELVFVVAVADNGVIGDGNALPWRLRSDLKRFRQITWNHPVVMGRKTFASIGKALPGRTNIVVTRDDGFRAPGCICVTSLDRALDIARADCLRRNAASIMVIGGGELFAQWLDRADRIELTEVHVRPTGDAFFPATEHNAWRETYREDFPAGEQDSAAYSYVTLERPRVDPDIAAVDHHAAP